MKAKTCSRGKMASSEAAQVTTSSVAPSQQEQRGRHPHLRIPAASADPARLPAAPQKDTRRVTVQTGAVCSGVCDGAPALASAARLQASTLLIQNLSPHAAARSVWRIPGNCVVLKQLCKKKKKSPPFAEDYPATLAHVHQHKSGGNLKAKQMETGEEKRPGWSVLIWGPSQPA